MNYLKNWLDSILGKLTMYHVVLIGLIVIALTGFALMIVGYLDYSPWVFMLTFTTMIAVSYVSNRLFGWLFGVKPYRESAIITGLILALVFSPPTSAMGAAPLVLVAIIAMASKYILNVRGKHIFNPAAIAIVIASVGQLAYASWWIATPALLPITLVVMFVILYKTQKLQMGLLFLAVAILLVIVQTALISPLSNQAIMSAVTSWPFVFFAGVMLSEPQTLPPRRTQQYIFAVLVAGLMTVPFHYGTIVMTPALALVIGNAVAFYCSIRRGVMLRLVSKKSIGINGYEFTFDTKPFAFVPGQFIEIDIPHSHMDIRGSRRVFSIIGQPNADQISIATRIPDQSPSSFKRSLLALKTGSSIRGTRVAGDFVLPNDPDIPIVFIAGGIGITPLMSFLMDSKKRSVTLIYAVSSVADILFVKELRRYDVNVIIVSPDSGTLPDSEWQHEVGRLDTVTITKYIDVNRQPHVYISGPTAMVNQTKLTVRQLGVKTIRTDQFTGY